jgi:hypothetical protein
MKIARLIICHQYGAEGMDFWMYFQRIQIFCIVMRGGI